MPPRGAKRKTKGKKKKKDPNKPKRAMSSFMFFANEKRNEVRTAFPDLKITEIGKKLGEMWKLLDAEQKKKYEDEAKRDKERYVHEMEKYMPPSDESASEDEEPKKKKRKPKPKRDPNKPRRAMSSFMFFANDKRGEVREKYPDLKVTEIGKKLSEMWKEITPEDKKIYEDKANKDKARYHEAMQSYNPTPEPPAPESESSSSSSESESDSESA